MTTDTAAKRPQLTLLFLLRDNQILLAMKKIGHGSGKWNGTGGKCEPGETPEQAAIRECQEEVGVTARAITPAGILRFYQEPPVDMYSNIDVHVYTCREWEGDPHESEEMKPKWFDIDTIPYENMWQDDQHWLPHVLAGKIVDGTFVFDDAYKLIRYDVTTKEAL